MSPVSIHCQQFQQRHLLQGRPDFDCTGCGSPFGHATPRAKWINLTIKSTTGSPDRFEPCDVHIAVATIRAVARGVIGVAALQSFLIGIGLVIAGVPGASLITLAALLLGIIQIGPTPVVIPVIIWAWFAMDTVAALLFTVYMIPVNLIDNVLRPLLMGRGLDTPIVVILIGLIGGTLSLGLTGLFLGPIVLAVIWELVVAWIRESENA